MRSKHCAFLTVLMSVSAASTPVLKGASHTIYNLGTLGGSFSVASAINDRGQITGTSTVAETIPHGPELQRGFLYTDTPGSGGMMHDLGHLGGNQSYGGGINEDGHIAGASLLGTFGPQHAILYAGTPGSGGMMHDLGTLAGTQSSGNALNASGQVTGSSMTPTGFHAFLYMGAPGAGVMHDLGTLGGSFSLGQAINDSGHVVGRSLTSGEDNHAFLYTGTPGIDGVMHDLSPFDGVYSDAVAINNSGHITGASTFPIGDGNFGNHAFLYTGMPGIDGVMHDLGTLGGTSSEGRDINDVGQIVGGSLTLNDGRHAFLYVGTPGVDGRMIDLDAWLDSIDPIEGAKWTLDVAHGINNYGLIVGSGWYDDGAGGLSDGQRAFLLDASSLLVVPEPSNLALLVLAIPALLRRPLRRRYNVVEHQQLCVRLVMLSCVYAASFSAAAAASFQGMGGEESVANAVSADGSTAVGADWTIFGHEAFQWTSGGGMQFIGDLPGGALGSIANAASSDGSVIVGLATVSFGANYEASLWTGSGIQSLGDLDGGSFKSEAYGVSGDGSIVVGYGTSSQGRQAFRHTMEEGMQGLGDFNGGEFASAAYGISGDGNTIVGYGTSGQGSEAFRWTSSGGMQGIGDLAGGAFSSVAHAVSGDGSVIVGSGTSASGTEAFRWTNDDGMRGLGDLSGGSFSSVATAVSADGLTVVGRSSTSLGSEAFIWDAANGMRNLHEVLTDDYDLDLVGWALYEAKGVSANGRTIVGYGLNPSGGFEAWIAVLDVSPAILEGDFNNDGTVDAADYTVWRNGLGSIYTQADYNAWKTKFGRSFGAGGDAALSTGPLTPGFPEPSAFVLMILAAACVRLRRRCPISQVVEPSTTGG